MTGKTIKAKEILELGGVRALEAELDGNGLITIDMEGVESVGFVFLRMLLNKKRAGWNISVINACEAVAEKFEDSGISSYINVTRRPKPLDISKYSEFGGGFLSTAYNSADGDSMLKVYGGNVPYEVVVREKNVARSVLQFGINTPMVGTIYEYEDKKGIDFERIEGKRSFSRIISEEPQRLEEMTVRFAAMCRKLHSTECDTTIFRAKKDMYRDVLSRPSAENATLREKAIVFLEGVPDRTTCLHGDMQLSNVITDGSEDYWIDLSDFGYGNNMLDLGMWYFLTCLNPDELCRHVFHLGRDQMMEIWNIFVREYFGIPTSEMASVQHEVEPFAALHMLYLGSQYNEFKPGMLEYINEIFSSL